MLTPPNLCQACIHEHPYPGGYSDKPRTCDAYPDGIPWDFLFGGAAHLSSDGTDKGVIFESRGGEYSQRLIEGFADFWDTFADQPELGGPPPTPSVGESG